MPHPLLEELQAVIEREIPVCGALGIRVASSTEALDSLRMAMPLAPNRNHQQTAFAGSLSTLCTIAGWGASWLELEQLADAGAGRAIVIRRGTIKYHEPVTAEQITAHCLPATEEARGYFREMLTEKGQSKIDVEVQIPGAAPDRPAVAFKGSYVVLPVE